MPDLALRAYAKINLCLEVLGLRSDGFHEVRTVLQTIDLADDLRIAPSRDVGLECSGMDVAADNLILRAARLLQNEAGVDAGCRIACEKRIPIGAGLGGGSADAGATLVGLQRLWGTRLGMDELARLASLLGSDVPFMLQGGTALAIGTGATVEPLPDATAQWLAVVPLAAETATKTAEMYRLLESKDFSDGTSARLMAEAIRAGRIAYEHVGSAFERAAAVRWPSVGRSLTALRESGALAASVSGAGPSTFGLYGSQQAATAGCEAVRAAGLRAEVHRFLPRMES
jgi:4-diphosphocytidyl-2-C-methyl-D-erythritol kinase